MGRNTRKIKKKGSCVERISTHKNVNNDRVNMKFCAKYVLTGQGRVDRQLMSRKKLFCTKKTENKFYCRFGRGNVWFQNNSENS